MDSIFFPTNHCNTLKEDKPLAFINQTHVILEALVYTVSVVDCVSFPFFIFYTIGRTIYLFILRSEVIIEI